MAEGNTAPEIKTFDELKKEFEKMFLFADEGVLRLLCATVIGNQLDNDPIWLMLVASSSGGKSELINTFSNIKVGSHNLIFPISDLTTNTFASGMKRTGQETSLLHRMPPGAIMTFKDFTSMLSKRKEDRIAIMGQMREIYDQKYLKETGTGEQIKWEGKVGAIAGSTEVIYQQLEDLSAMGDRFIMYSMTQPDSLELARFSMQYKKDGRSKSGDRDYIASCVKSYCEYIISNMEEDRATLSEDTEEDIISVADFCTKARSGVIINERKGYIDFVPSREMPVRMMEQLLAIAKAFLVMKKTEPKMLGPKEKEAQKNTLSKEERNVLYKIAFDSIPIKRRIALKALAKYEGGVTTKGLATSIDYPTPTVGGWLAQLNGLGICSREARSGPKGDIWKMHDKYRKIMVKFEHVQVVQGILEGDEDEEDQIDEAWDALNVQQATAEAVPPEEELNW